MKDLEAVAILSDLKAGLTPKQSVAVLKGIQALVEKMQREQKAKELKELHRNKCRDCEHFCFGYGGLCSTIGSCEIRDEPFTENRRASNRACKQFKKLGPCGSALRNEEA